MSRQTIKDVFDIFLIVLIIYIVIYEVSIVPKSKSNDEIIIRNYIYEKLQECLEKRGAFGDKVNYNINEDDIKPGNLNDCLKKLKAHERELEDFEETTNNSCGVR